MPGLLEFIRAHRDVIMSTMMRKLRFAHPDHDRDDLTNDLDKALDEVEHALLADRGASTPVAPTRLVDAMHHGKQRHRIIYDPASVVHDYGTVCDSVFEAAEHAGIHVSAREVQVFNRVIDAGAADAITAYWQEDHVEKRREASKQIGTLAHELRNALGSARMAFDLIREGKTPVNGRSAQIVVRSLDRMQSLVSEALTEVRARGTVPPVRPERVGMAALIREIVEASVHDADIAIEVDADESLAVEADRGLLTSALSNLVHNALKFTRPGGSVRCRAFERGTVVVIEVEDECGGLPDGAAEELFQPFVQKGSERSGVGLGLTITREAVEAHGGTIAVRNLPGKGCVFRVELRSLAVRPNPTTQSVESPTG